LTLNDTIVKLLMHLHSNFSITDMELYYADLIFDISSPSLRDVEDLT